MPAHIVIGMASTVCGWCGRLTHMKMIRDPHPVPMSRPPNGLQMYCAPFECENEACGNISIGHLLINRTHAGLGPAVVEVMTKSTDIAWTPAKVSRPDFPDVPTQIGEAAAEAHACLSIKAYRGAVALARAVVEATAKEKGITAGSLVKKIDDLHAAGHIRPFTREAAHEVRHGGNEIAHGDIGDEPMPAEDAEAIVELMDEILQEVYQQPAKMRKLKQSRLEREQRVVSGSP